MLFLNYRRRKCTYHAMTSFGWKRKGSVKKADLTAFQDAEQVTVSIDYQASSLLLD